MTVISEDFAWGFAMLHLCSADSTPGEYIFARITSRIPIFVSWEVVAAVESGANHVICLTRPASKKSRKEDDGFDGAPTKSSEKRRGDKVRGKKHCLGLGELLLWVPLACWRKLATEFLKHFKRYFQCKHFYLKHFSDEIMTIAQLSGGIGAFLKILSR